MAKQSSAANAGSPPTQDLGNTSSNFSDSSAEIDALLDEAGVVDVPESGTPDPVETPTPDPIETPSTPVGDPSKPATPAVAPKKAAPAAPAKAPAKPAEPARPATPATPATPAAPATPAPAAPAAPATPPTTGDKELDAIPEPKGMNPQTASNWKSLRTIAEREKKSRAELATKYEEAVNALASFEKAGGLTPALKAEVDELRAFRRTFDIQRDPEFVGKFDTVIDKNNSEIYALLEKRGLKKDVLDSIKAEGGLAGKARSWWEENEIEVDGEKKKVAGYLKLLRESALPEDNEAAVVIKNKLDANAQLAYDKKQEVEKASVHQSDWQKAREQKQKEQVDADNKVMQEAVTEIQSAIPWARLQEVPANATPEQKAQIEKENKMYIEAEQRFPVALNPPNALARVHTAIAACLSFKYASDIEDLKAASAAEKATSDAEIARLTEENEKLRTAGSTNLPNLAPTGKKTGGSGDKLKMSNEAAIDAGLDEAGE